MSLAPVSPLGDGGGGGGEGGGILPVTMFFSQLYSMELLFAS